MKRNYGASYHDAIIAAELRRIAIDDYIAARATDSPSIYAASFIYEMTSRENDCLTPAPSAPTSSHLGGICYFGSFFAVESIVARPDYYAISRGTHDIERAYRPVATSSC